jgi:hypothetical protein
MLMVGMKEGEERYENARKIETEIMSLLDQQRVALLELGAAGRLLMSGELEEVLPLEDAEKLEQAKPISPSGEIRINPAADRQASQFPTAQLFAWRPTSPRIPSEG